MASPLGTLSLLDEAISRLATLRHFERLSEAGRLARLQAEVGRTLPAASRGRGFYPFKERG